LPAIFATAARLSLLALAAYGPLSKAEEVCADLGLWKPVEINNGRASVLLAYDYGEAYLAIRGTDDKFDWIDNTRTKRRFINPIGNRVQISAHAGFIDHATLIRDELGQVDAKRLIGRNDLYLTGHSLGGAVATLLPLITDWIHPERIVTFGAPRALAYESAGMYPYDVLRFVGQTDIVPMLPLSWRFSHVGGVRYLNGGFFSERRFGGLSKYWRLARTWMMRRPSQSVVEQHAMTRYSAALKEWA